MTSEEFCHGKQNYGLQINGFFLPSLFSVMIEIENRKARIEVSF